MSDIAILLATYNGEKYILEQLTSLFAQTNQDAVIYVHDDGSTDKTMEIVEKYAFEFPERVKILEGPSKKSAKANFLWMLSMVEADFYFLCDQDDVWCENKVERSLSAISNVERKRGDVPAIVFSDMYVTDDKLEIIADSFVRYIGRDVKNKAYTQVLIDNPGAGCTFCLNRKMRDIACEVVKEINLDNIPMHDSLLLVLGDIFGRTYGIDEPLVYYRQTGENTMGAVTESEAEKAGRNAADVVTGGFLAKKKAFVMEARIFAEEILKISTLPEEDRRLLTEFVNIGEKGKLYRMKFYKKNKFTRAHHNIWMRLWV